MQGDGIGSEVCQFNIRSAGERNEIGGDGVIFAPDVSIFIDGRDNFLKFTVGYGYESGRNYDFSGGFDFIEW